LATCKLSGADGAPPFSDRLADQRAGAAWGDPTVSIAQGVSQAAPFYA
jgi:hypothetical protein